jgi:hypothetical protein
MEPPGLVVFIVGIATDKGCILYTRNEIIYVKVVFKGHDVAIFPHAPILR